MEDILTAEQTDSHPLAEQDSDVVNFQRKIIPLDALNLALEELREKRLRNSAGRRKQELIVCATLVDKVSNLGGFARTAEIFAADRLVIPDLRAEIWTTLIVSALVQVIGSKLKDVKRRYVKKCCSLVPFPFRAG
jgi:tRNA G18 (ribose-2'-O)-methylase SpoU